MVLRPDGLELRGLRGEDMDQVCELLASRGEDADAVDLRLVVADPAAGLDAVAVVVDGDRVVSTATLLDETLRLGGVAIPAGQVELVATHRDHEGRGLVRDLMAWAHRRSRDRGHLAQIMTGIPYFYRQFGYSYSIRMHRWRRRTETPSAGATSGVSVRRATEADIPALAALHDDAQRGTDLAMPRSPACWRWVVARDGTHQLVAERAGAVVGTARFVPPPEDPMLGELAAADPAAALALLAYCDADDLPVAERPGTIAGDAVEPYLAPGTGHGQEWYYARIEDLGALLTHLSPLLAARLAAAGMDDKDHEVLISSFRSHVRFTIGPAGVTAMTAGGPEQAPGSKGGCGIPPDALPPLLFGPYGALGLEEMLPDCYLAGTRHLMAALFPPVTADLLTFYLPT